ncbi:hypothetical protein [Acidithiobacillus marinus]|uniref:hypothetical protein n=1 Tax=Acidithiobacillus marinus TaxID=187490 RepID=UPI001551DFDB|nr:hypothetical protein [Acidithiobacillus marinus]
MLIAAIAAAFVILILIRMFFVVIKWEIRWDMRIFELGVHCFLLGAIITVPLMLYMGY